MKVSLEESMRQEEPIEQSSCVDDALSEDLGQTVIKNLSFPIFLSSK